MQLMSIKIGLLSVLLLKTCVRKKGGLGGFAPQTLTRSYYFEPPLSKKRSLATVRRSPNFDSNSVKKQKKGQNNNGLILGRVSINTRLGRVLGLDSAHP